MAVFRRAFRGRDVFPGDAASRHAGRCVDDLSNRRRHISSLHRSFDRWRRRIERTLELLNWVMVVAHPRGLPSARALFSPRCDLDGCRCRPRRFRSPEPNIQFRACQCRLSVAGRAGRLLGRRRHGEHRAVELGARQGIRDGTARRIHSGRCRWTQSQARAHGVHFHARRRQHAPMERLVADCERGPVGSVLHRRSARHGSAGRAVRHRRSPAGRTCRASASAAALASAVGDERGSAAGIVVGVLATWILFKTQLDIIESMVRSITDILWTGSLRVRTWSRGDVRVVYYGALAVVCLWGIFALRLAQPIILIMLGGERRQLRVHDRLVPSSVRQHPTAP